MVVEKVLLPLALKAPKARVLLDAHWEHNGGRCFFHSSDQVGVSRHGRRESGETVMIQFM